MVGVSYCRRRSRSAAESWGMGMKGRLYRYGKGLWRGDFDTFGVMPFGKLPNGDRAVVDIEKLIGYCQNPNHEDGKHKARVFASALGLRSGNAEWLRERLLLAAGSEPAEMIAE